MPALAFFQCCMKRSIIDMLLFFFSTGQGEIPAHKPALLHIYCLRNVCTFRHFESVHVPLISLGVPVRCCPSLPLQFSSYLLFSAGE